LRYNDELNFGDDELDYESDDLDREMDKLDYEDQHDRDMESDEFDREMFRILDDELDYENDEGSPARRREPARERGRQWQLRYNDYEDQHDRDMEGEGDSFDREMFRILDDELDYETPRREFSAFHRDLDAYKLTYLGAYSVVTKARYY
jgi:hypothetical protein